MKKGQIFLIIFLVFLGTSHARKLTLEEAVRLALKRAPELRAYESATEGLEFAARAYRSLRWGTLELELQYERHGTPVAVGPITGLGQFPEFSKDIYFWNLSLKVPLFQPNFSQELKKRRLSARAKRFWAIKTRHQLVAATERLFFQALYFENLKGLLERSLALAKRELKQARLRYEQGKVPKLDLLYFEKRLNEIKAELDYASKMKELSRKLLCERLLEETCDFQLEGSLKSWRGENLEWNPEELPEVRALREELKAAEADLASAKRLYLPRLVSFASYGHRYGSGLSGEEEVWTVGVKLEATLWDFGLRRHRVAQREKSVESARHKLKSALLEAKRGALSAKASIEAVKAKLKRLRAAEALAQSIYEKESIRYEAGVGSVTELIRAESELLRLKTEILKAYYELQLARIELRLSTGTIEEDYAK